MQPREGSGEGVVKIRSWTEFKRLAESLNPKTIVYNIEQDGLSPKRELTNLRLILPSGPAYYVFIDFPKGEALRETGIPSEGMKRKPLHRRRRRHKISQESV